MKKRCVAIVLSAGQGKRMGTSRNSISSCVGNPSSVTVWKHLKSQKLLMM